jgi:hypothetical protein
MATLSYPYDSITYVRRLHLAVTSFCELDLSCELVLVVS